MYSLKKEILEISPPFAFFLLKAVICFLFGTNLGLAIFNLLRLTFEEVEEGDEMVVVEDYVVVSFSIVEFCFEDNKS